MFPSKRIGGLAIPKSEDKRLMFSLAASSYHPQRKMCPHLSKKKRLLLSLEIMAPDDDVVSQPSTSLRPPQAPPSSPHLQACEQVHTLNTGQFKELLKAIQAI